MNPRSFLRYLKSPAVATWKKLLLLFAAVYVLSPVDAIPDVIPVIGWLDDLGVLTAAGLFLTRDVRRFESDAEVARVHPPR